MMQVTREEGVRKCNGTLGRLGQDEEFNAGRVSK